MKVVLEQRNRVRWKGWSDRDLAKLTKHCRRSLADIPLAVVFYTSLFLDQHSVLASLADPKKRSTAARGNNKTVTWQMTNECIELGWGAAKALSDNHGG
jgi:hypothetical protein